MTTFKNVNDKALKKHVEQLAKKAMNQGNAVKKVVMDTGEKHVHEDVYDVYTPNPDNPYSYKRTGKLATSWDSSPTPDGIEIFNTRQDGDKYIPEVIETGQNYDYDFEYRGKPRPFIENTRKELDGSKKLTEALGKDLNGIGIKTN